MSDDDIQRDIAEEDELRRLLHRPTRPAIPPFAAVASKAQRPRGSALRLAALAVGIVVVAVATVALIHPSTPLPVASSPSPTPGPTERCAVPTSLDVTRQVLSPTLIASLSGVEVSDPQTNQMRWTLRFLSTNDAAHDAAVGINVEILAAGNAQAHILGYELIEPEARTLSAGDLVTIAPCKAATIVVRTAGPLLDGTWPYVVTVEKVGLPEGQTVPTKLEVTLACDNKTYSCKVPITGATPAPTPTPNMAVLKPSFGVIYWGTSGTFDPTAAPKIRREGETNTTAQLVGTFFNQFHGAISPDGSRAIYAGQPNDGSWGLYLLDGSKPNEHTRVLSFSNEILSEIPSDLVWASDGSAVAFIVTDGHATQGVAPQYAAVRTLDLATGKVTELARVTDGSSYTLLGWDRRAGTIAAFLIPHPGMRGALSYVVLGPSGVRTTPVSGGWSAIASPDARTVVGFRCDGAPAGCSLWTWPLADFNARVDQHLAAGLSLALEGWRPGSDDIALIVSPITLPPAPQTPRVHIELWSPTSGRRTIYDFTNGLTPPGPCFFRADGSAFFITGYGEATVIDLATGATSPLPFPAATAPYDKPFPAGSIRLGSR